MKQKTAHPNNFKAGRTAPIEYLVIHFTGNQGDTAENNAVYFAREPVGVSAHYFVDESEIWQSVADSDTAWHCGGGRQSDRGGTFFGRCRNANSIGIELCLNDGQGYLRRGTMRRAAALVRTLMAQYQIPIGRVIRHYDITGKHCPGPMVDREELWHEFLKQIEEMEESDVKRYNTVQELPDWARETIDKLIAHGSLQGDGTGLDLSEDMLRLLVIQDREGLYQ